MIDQRLFMESSPSADTITTRHYQHESEGAMIGQQVRTSSWQKGVNMAARHSSLAYVALRMPRNVASYSLYLTTKRIVDVLVSIVLLILFAPLMLVVAALIRLDSPGAALFVQRRVGKHGRIFDFYKFRSMRTDVDNDRAHRRFAEAYINGEKIEDLVRTQEATVFKPKNGNNLTRMGKFLRATSLDELPQLINVLKGDMSLVGPRPSIYYEVDLYRDWHRRRLTVTPGMTGYAQINGRSRLRFDEIVSLDIEYIRKCSLLLDLKILLLTIPVVLSTRSAR
jgi:lipopolysaccharide/colanic/teichoic acid biosynthesis glycosyltransferase